MSANDCLFCKIIDKEIPANIVCEDDQSLSFRDINPQAPTHVLVIPKTHVASIDKAEDKELIGSLFRSACQVASQENLGGGFRLVVNTGDDGGQTVHHLHIHVLGGRQLKWPPG